MAKHTRKRIRKTKKYRNKNKCKSLKGGEYVDFFPGALNPEVMDEVHALAVQKAKEQSANTARANMARIHPYLRAFLMRRQSQRRVSPQGSPPIPPRRGSQSQQESPPLPPRIPQEGLPPPIPPRRGSQSHQGSLPPPLPPRGLPGRGSSRRVSLPPPRRPTRRPTM